MRREENDGVVSPKSIPVTSEHLLFSFSFVFTSAKFFHVR